MLQSNFFSKNKNFRDALFEYIPALVISFLPGANLRGKHRGARTLPIFCNHLFFFVITLTNNKLLFEVELILNNAPLTYVYPNVEIETCLTPNYSYGRWLLYSPNATSINKINRISNHF